MKQAALRTARKRGTYLQTECKAPIAPQTQGCSTRGFQRRIPSVVALFWNKMNVVRASGPNRRPWWWWNKVLATSHLPARRSGWRRPKQRTRRVSRSSNCYFGLCALEWMSCIAWAGVCRSWTCARVDHGGRGRAKLAAEQTVRNLSSSPDVAAGEDCRAQGNTTSDAVRDAEEVLNLRKDGADDRFVASITVASTGLVPCFRCLTRRHLLGLPLLCTLHPFYAEMALLVSSEDEACERLQPDVLVMIPKYPAQKRTRHWCWLGHDAHGDRRASHVAKAVAEAQRLFLSAPDQSSVASRCPRNRPTSTIDLISLTLLSKLRQRCLTALDNSISALMTTLSWRVR